MINTVKFLCAFAPLREISSNLVWGGALKPFSRKGAKAQRKDLHGPFFIP